MGLMSRENERQHKPVFPYWGKHKTSTSSENKSIVSNENQRWHKTVFSHWDKENATAQFQTQESYAK